MVRGKEGGRGEFGERKGQEGTFDVDWRAVAAVFHDAGEEAGDVG